MTRKYQPFKDHLGTLASAGRQSVEFDFAEIADLVGGLPSSAYESRQWWANSSLTQAQSWRGADWYVGHVNFDRQRVRFARGKVGGSYLAGGRRSASETAAAVLLAETDSADLDVRVTMTWQRAGRVTLDGSGYLVFPELPRLPGIYRLTLADAPRQELPHVYVGETEDLRKRATQYRRPGPTQQTSQRIQAELLDHLRREGRVAMAVASEAIIHGQEESEALPLGRKTARVLAEHAALALTYLDRYAVVVNRDKDTDDRQKPGSSSVSRRRRMST